MHEDIPKYVLSTPDFENIIQENKNDKSDDMDL